MLPVYRPNFERVPDGININLVIGKNAWQAAPLASVTLQITIFSVNPDCHQFGYCDVQKINGY